MTWRLKSTLWLRCLGMSFLPQKARPRSIAPASVCPVLGAHSKDNKTNDESITIRGRRALLLLTLIVLVCLDVPVEVATAALSLLR